MTSRTRSRTQTVFFHNEQPALLGHQNNGERSKYHGHQDCWDRHFNGRHTIPTPNYHNVKDLHSTCGYLTDDDFIEKEDEIDCDSDIDSDIDINSDEEESCDDYDSSEESVEGDSDSDEEEEWF